VVTLDEIATEPAAAGDTLPVTLRWTVTAAPPAGAAYSTFAHLEDMNGHRWSQIEQDGYPAEQWRSGDVILERLDVPVPPGMPPGENGLYRLRLGRFDPATGDRLPRLDAAGAFAGDSLISDDVAILHGPPPDPLPEPPFVARDAGDTAAEGLRFLGHEPLPRAAETGEPLPMAFWWSSTTPLSFRQLRLSLVDETGTARELGRGQPAYNTYPFDQWSAPAFVIDRQVFRVPDDLTPGDYAYRMELLDAQGQPAYSADLGSLAVAQTERLYELPPFATEVGATFGGEIALPGYTLREADGTLGLELVWQAVTQPTADYTVFVHVLRPDGTCCAWQSDAMPRGGAYPTSRWRPGEVVVDTYAIALPPGLPPGEYPIEVGLYLAEAGQRLGVDGAEPAADAVRLASIAEE
jgi:hypothetical protein